MLVKSFFVTLLSIISYQAFCQENQEFKNKREVQVELVYKFKIDEGDINHLRVVILMPNDVKERQEVKSIKFSVNPDSLLSNRGNAYAVFHLRNIPKKFEIKMTSQLTLFRHISNTNSDTAIDFAPYLTEEKFIETSSKEIITTAATLKGNSDLETTVNTYEFVKNHIQYVRKQGIGAEAVLESGEGRCADYSDLFVALLRVNKIPAKTVRGMVVNASTENAYHQWAEAYLKNQGWVLFDPTTSHTSVYKVGKNYEIVEKNKYIILSELRNDLIVGEGRFKYHYWGSRGCKMKSTLKWDFMDN